ARNHRRRDQGPIGRSSCPYVLCGGKTSDAIPSNLTHNANVYAPRTYRGESTGGGTANCRGGASELGFALVRPSKSEHAH
ncbi:MAG TPA: hypothetical protein VIV60_11745, partial [Polyangiaceae bacterium]